MLAITHFAIPMLSFIIVSLETSIFLDESYTKSMNTFDKLKKLLRTLALLFQTTFNEGLQYSRYFFSTSSCLKFLSLEEVVSWGGCHSAV